MPFDTALKIEARWFTNVLMNPSSEAMIRSLFINKQALEKGAVRPKDVPDMKVKKLGVLGAGMMGAGIGFVSPPAQGIEVVLDRPRSGVPPTGAGRPSKELLDEGRQAQEEDDRRPEGRNPRPSSPRPLITASCDGCDLIVEAVFEDPKI